MTPAEMGSRGGIASAAKLTPAQRRKRAIKASLAAVEKRKKARKAAN